MKVLHTESSCGWGGQEIRILKEAEGLRERGHEVYFALATGGGLVEKAKEKGFVVYQLPMKKSAFIKTLVQLLRIMKDKEVDIVNTHSSWDAWIGGIAARISRRKLLRTRHLSTKIKGGLNSTFLYGRLADFVVTTSSIIIPPIVAQAKISPNQIRCIPTGVDTRSIVYDKEEVTKFRKMVAKPDEILVGTVCFVRSWKGVQDLMKAASIVKSQNSKIKWVVVGGGYYKDYMGMAETLGIKDVLTFTGHLENPFTAIAALDVFLLLSTAHEGISQASLQAAYLGKPLITTNVGGLPEVCLHDETGIVVPPFSPEKVAEAVLKLASDTGLRKKMGQNARHLVENKFTFDHTLDGMESVYSILSQNKPRKKT